jgi:hypothetical protein
LDSILFYYYLKSCYSFAERNHHYFSMDKIIQLHGNFCIFFNSSKIHISIIDIQSTLIPGLYILI